MVKETLCWECRKMRADLCPKLQGLKITGIIAEDAYINFGKCNNKIRHKTKCLNVISCPLFEPEINKEEIYAVERLMSRVTQLNHQLIEKTEILDKLKKLNPNAKEIELKESIIEKIKEELKQCEEHRKLYKKTILPKLIEKPPSKVSFEESNVWEYELLSNKLKILISDLYGDNLARIDNAKRFFTTNQLDNLLLNTGISAKAIRDKVKDVLGDNYDK